MPTVERNAKFLSNPMVVGQFTAESVILNEDLQGDIRLTS